MRSGGDLGQGEHDILAGALLFQDQHIQSAMIPWSSDISDKENDTNENITITAKADNSELFSEINILESSPEQLALIPIENKFGTSVISITVKDDGGVLNGGIDSTTVSFNATVNPVNDAPTLTSNKVYLENGTEDIVYSIKASDLLQGYSDVDGDTLSVQDLTVSSGSGSLTDNQDGTWTFKPSHVFYGDIGY